MTGYSWRGISILTPDDKKDHKIKFVTVSNINEQDYYCLYTNIALDVMEDFKCQDSTNGIYFAGGNQKFIRNQFKNIQNTAATLNSNTVTISFEQSVFDTVKQQSINVLNTAVLDLSLSQNQFNGSNIIVNFYGHGSLTMDSCIISNIEAVLFSYYSSISSIVLTNNNINQCSEEVLQFYGNNNRVLEKFVVKQNTIKFLKSGFVGITSDDIVMVGFSGVVVDNTFESANGLILQFTESYSLSDITWQIENNVISKNSRRSFDFLFALPYLSSCTFIMRKNHFETCSIAEESITRVQFSNCNNCQKNITALIDGNQWNNNSATNAVEFMLFYPTYGYVNSSIIGNQFSENRFTDSTINLNAYNTSLHYNVFTDNETFTKYYLSIGIANPAYLVNATENWWSTTDSNIIEARIFDGRNHSGRARVDYDPYLTSSGFQVSSFVS